jgi:tetratricopeptide (TPR) repeat protein
LARQVAKPVAGNSFCLHQNSFGDSLDLALLLAQIGVITMQHNALLTVYAVIGLSSLLPNAPGQESWSHKWVITKRTSIKLQDTLDKKKTVGELDEIICRVVTEEDGWLLVSSKSALGWFEKADAVLLEDAAKYFTERINADKTDARSYACRASALGFKDEFKAAIKDFTEALRLNPKEATWYSGRGINYAAIKDYDKAIADYDQSLKLVKNADAYNKRALAYLSKNDYDKAVADFTEAIQLDHKNFYYYSGRGQAYYGKNAYDKALVNFDESIRLYAKDPDIFVWRGNVHLAKRVYDQAISDYDEALRLDPKYAAAYHNRGMAYANKNQYDKAIADYGEALLLSPKDASAHENRGHAYAAKKDYDKAIADYNESLRLDPQAIDVHNHRGIAFQNKKQYDKAIADFKEALRLDAKNVQACNNLAWLFATCPNQQQRSGKKAIEYATKACDWTKWKDAPSLDTLAAAYAENGQFDEAVKYQGQALEDPAFSKEWGEPARRRLELYKNKKPYRDD